MLKKKTLSAFAAALLATATAVEPVAAQGYGGYGDNGPYQNGQYDYGYGESDYDRDRAAQDPRDGYGYGYSARPGNYAYQRDCERQRANNKVGGFLIGAIAGGLLGSTIARGPSRGGGTAVGAILGGAIGASIGSDLDCEDRSYVQNTYYDGFERGRPYATYRWRNPRSGNYGAFMVGDYYRGRAGVRCATYSQTIWVHGRPQEARGHACRRRDGTWDIID